MANVVVDQDKPTIDAWAEKMMNSVEYDLKMAAKKYAEIEKKTRTIRLHVAPHLPEGVNLPTSLYDIVYESLHLYIPEKEGRPWRGMQGTAGIVWQLRKFFQVPKFERRTEGYDGKASTIFTGNGKMPVTGEYVFLTVTCNDQIPDSCTIEEYEVVETIKKVRTVCK